MNGFRFKGMVEKPSNTYQGKAAPVREMQHLDIREQQAGTKRNFSDGDSSSGGPPKRAKSTEEATADMARGLQTQASRPSRSMQAVWEQAHISRCLTRLQDLELELAAAESAAEQDDVRSRIERLKRSMKEAGYDFEGMQLD
ncbi:hypothetical protein LTR36_006137 [Oleoguttula mirabilis]|uniref:BAG domain-containing protein n=1 Tax=Oleoguttula mirabilis TaxID=1507867 RepID=A0AAV9JC25_9PEZI|nr:hypothetical protein LTR36_006137 [Oleoguttula mirabilis]